ncbi:hypothetical protein [Candidatus Macondimonas diazotrophica]|uniref:hypothetical protein n=1 Tax=Candidatus Macondimonas diazotrophica TaxID=2305248 RepID=UPI00143239A0|nr:hypothetical protein [Candidatus Macondimonas diazotrophica]NCU00576.1 hypothetical protein [Candidatus Macondimonas diazotrophica]
MAALLLGGLIGAAAASGGWLAPGDALLVEFDLGSGTYQALTGWSALTLDAGPARENRHDRQVASSVGGVERRSDHDFWGDHGFGG